MKNKDIIIIGGGIMGLTTAWKLSQTLPKTKKILVFEKNTCLQGASIVAPGALMPYNPSRLDYIPTLQRKSLDIYPDFVKKLEEETGIDTKYSQNGRLQPIQSAHHLKKIQEDVEIAQKTWRKVRNKPAMEILNSEQLKQREPNLIAAKFGTLYCRVSGHIHSPLLMQALYKACKNNGVEILENTAINNIKVEKNTVKYVETSTEVFNGKQVIITSGAWSSQLIKAKTEIVPVKGQVIALETKKTVLQKSFIRARGLYIIQVSQKKIIIGATKEVNQGFDINPTEESTQKMLDKALKEVPLLQNCNVIEAYCGVRPVSLSSKPFMGRIEGIDNLYMCCGHGGIGICMAPIAGVEMQKC